MPYSEKFTVSKIIVDFTLADGTVKTLETKMSERNKAAAEYDDAIASGKSAVLSFTQSSVESKHMLRVILGNFPPQSKAHLRAICTQELDFEDLSYCFRLPMAFVPAYMGDIQNFIKKGVSFKGQDIPSEDLSLLHQQEHLRELQEYLSQPVCTKSSVIWDISIQVRSSGKLQRLTSINHSVQVFLNT